jgi:hypothetical protein
MSRRYLVEQAEGWPGAEVWRVTDTKEKNPLEKQVDVWVSGGDYSCTKCTGPLKAMLSSCPHTNAVRRKINTSKEDK